MNHKNVKEVIHNGFIVAVKYMFVLVIFIPLRPLGPSVTTVKKSAGPQVSLQ